MEAAMKRPSSQSGAVPSAVPSVPLGTSWKTLSEQPILHLAPWVKEAARDNQTVHIGTDSLQTGRFSQFVTVVAILTPGKGGRAAYSRSSVPRIRSLRERLLKEVWLSVDLALELQASVPGELFVHIDANPVVQHASSAYLQELVGMVVGQGFKAKIKPDSWCAAHAADHVVRVHQKDRRPSL